MSTRSSIAVWSLIVVFVLTHWPRLELPLVLEGSDKIIHMTVFGLLCAPIWWARWFKTPWELLAAAMAWAAFDEWTQSIPFIHRSATKEDFLANACGVVAGASVAFLNWPSNSEDDEASVRLLAKPNAIPALLSAGSLGSLVGAFLSVASLPRALGITIPQSVLIGIVLGGCTALQIIWWKGLQRTRLELSPAVPTTPFSERITSGTSSALMGGTIGALVLVGSSFILQFDRDIPVSVGLRAAIVLSITIAAIASGVRGWRRVGSPS